jgi:multidrug transporter EmrE-like cation transporter
MYHNHSHIVIPRVGTSSVILLGLLILNLAFNILANAAFKVSAFSPNWRGILTWQVIGNLAGFITVLTLTGLLRYMPLSVAFPLTTGLTIVGVQVVAAHFYFHEQISYVQWWGTLLITLGVFFVYK